MEVIPAAVSILIEESSRTAEARRTARDMAFDLGMDESAAERVAIVTTEACTNLLKHAGGGQILLQSAVDAADEEYLELLAIDNGPGMANLEACLQDGYSTASSPGQGLGAIRRLSQEAEIYTVPGKGTALMARWMFKRDRQPGAASVQVGAVNVPKPGQDVCGDSWGFAWHDGQLVIVVADGLGHGMEARLASAAAVRQLANNADLAPRPLLMRIHEALRSTRGAAVAVARLDPARGKLVFAGVGNIAARIYSRSEGRHNLVSLNGTAGHQCERIQEFSYPWPDAGLLVLHSDGLATGTALEPYPGLSHRDPALISAVLYRDFSRGRDDATVVVAKAS